MSPFSLDRNAAHALKQCTKTIALNEKKYYQLLEAVPKLNHYPFLQPVPLIGCTNFIRSRRLSNTPVMGWMLVYCSTCDMSSNESSPSLIVSLNWSFVVVVRSPASMTPGFSCCRLSALLCTRTFFGWRAPS